MPACSAAASLLEVTDRRRDGQTGLLQFGAGAWRKAVVTDTSGRTGVEHGVELPGLCSSAQACRPTPTARRGGGDPALPGDPLRGCGGADADHAEGTGAGDGGREGTVGHSGHRRADHRHRQRRTCP